MKGNKSVEQGIYVRCILALQKGHTSVKGKVLSQLLQVSDSYLKKLLAKMVKANLIISSANRAGDINWLDQHKILRYLMLFPP